MTRRCRRAVVAALAAAQLTTACFRYVPVTSELVAGTRIALEITDEGRVALAPTLGPGVVRIEGTLVGADGEALVVSAMQVTQLQLRPTSVDAVRVRVSREHVVVQEVRQLSKRRTLFVVGGATLAVVSFFVSKGWFGRSTPPDDGGGGGGPDQSRGISFAAPGAVLPFAGTAS